MPNYCVSFLIGGIARFRAEKTSTLYPDQDDPKLIEEIKEIRQMRYPAKICNDGVDEVQLFYVCRWTFGVV